MKLRRSLAVILCLLLLSLQTQALVHPLSHLGYGKAQETGLASSAGDGTCLQCALLAGGSNAIAADVAACHFGDIADVVNPPLYTSRTPDAPAWFQSRAPPALLV
jgi:hypothetical protein